MSKLIEGLESIKVLFDTKAKQSENAGYWKDFAGIIADAIETITEKATRIENMEAVIDDLEERVSIMSEHGLIPVSLRKPTDDHLYTVIILEKDTHGNNMYIPEEASYEDGKWGRWVDYSYDTEWIDIEWIDIDNVVYWLDLPEPPKEGAN